MELEFVGQQIVSQFDWHMMNRINSDAVLHRITFPPFWVSPFYSLEVPGIGLISLAKSAGFGNSTVEFFRLDPETEYLFSIFTPKSFLCIALPRIYSVAYIFG